MTWHMTQGKQFKRLIKHLNSIKEPSILDFDRRTTLNRLSSYGTAFNVVTIKLSASLLTSERTHSTPYYLYVAGGVFGWIFATRNDRRAGLLLFYLHHILTLTVVCCSSAPNGRPQLVIFGVLI